MKLDHIPPQYLGFLGAGILVGLLFSGLLLVSDLQKKITTAQQDYVSGLTAITSQRAVEAAFNGDLMQMQLLLKEVKSQPCVLLAAIYDVDNNLLVQAGEPRFNLTHSLSDTTAITLDESIAGYVTVVMTKNDQLSAIPKFLTLTLAVLGLAMLTWSIYHDNRWRNLPLFSSQGTTTEQIDNSVSDTDNNIATASEDELINQAPRHTIYGYVHIKNLEVLQQQLSGDAFRKAIFRFEKIIGDVLALYGGNFFEQNDNYYTLQFPYTDNISEAYFKAICSTYLTLELSGIINNIPLDLAGFVSSIDSSTPESNLPIAGLHIDECVANDAHICHRLNLMDVSNDQSRKVVVGFEQPFKSLLENQRKQLAQIL